MRLLDLQIFKPRRLLGRDRDVRAAGRGLLGELPGQRPRGGGPREGDQGAGPARRSCSSAATARRSSRPRSSTTPPAPSTASCAARARCIAAARARGHRRRRSSRRLPGVVTRHGAGPRPTLLEDLDRYLPARAPAAGGATSTSSACSIPCASIEFTRGCPWDCSFCSAWTFYGRSYRKAPPEAAAEDLARIREPERVHRRRRGVHPARARLRDRPARSSAAASASSTTSRPAATCCCKNKEVFAYWKRLGLRIHVPRHRGDRRGGAEGSTASG